MLNPGNRALAKRFLSWTGIKLLVSAFELQGAITQLTRPLKYARITSTRYTTAYFLFALITCTFLSTLQGITFADNSAAVGVINGHLSRAPALRGFPLFQDGVLQLCTSIPGQGVTSCQTMMTVKMEPSTLRLVCLLLPRYHDIRPGC